MPKFRIETHIGAPQERCFDLTRSIEVRFISSGERKEIPIEGRLSGLLEPGDRVTFREKIIGIMFHHRYRIDHYDRPITFHEELISGSPYKVRITHRFESDGIRGTRLIDDVRYRIPGGIVGYFVGLVIPGIFLKRMMRRRAAAIKEIAESNEWPRFIRDR